jgi:cell wall-associated NlpC family hydrolase
MNSEPKSIVDIFCDYLLTFLNKVPYHYSGDDPMEGFDCSGLAVEGGKGIGFFPRDFDMNAQDLYNRFKVDKIAINDNFRKGTLIFFGTSPKDVSHVGVVIFPEHKIMIEAGGGRKTTITEEEAKKLNAFVRLRPYRKDLVGFGDMFGQYEAAPEEGGP